MDTCACGAKPTAVGFEKKFGLGAGSDHNSVPSRGDRMPMLDAFAV
jgi:hypothetical protein